MVVRTAVMVMVMIIDGRIDTPTDSMPTQADACHSCHLELQSRKEQLVKLTSDLNEANVIRKQLKGMLYYIDIHHQKRYSSWRKSWNSVQLYLVQM